MATSIDLDVAFDEPTVEAALNEVTAGLNVTSEVINPSGPSGWPIVRFVAQTDDDLDALLKRYTGDDSEMVTDLRRHAVGV